MQPTTVRTVLEMVGCEGQPTLRLPGWVFGVAGGVRDGFVDSYLRVKRRDWGEHCAVLTDFERRATLDC